MSSEITLDISSLPKSAITELLDFYKFLAHQYELDSLKAGNENTRKPGSAKGKFEVPSEFFEPLPEEILNGFEK